LIDNGHIVGLSAFAVGGRLLATDESGLWTRVDASARLVAKDLALDCSPQSLAESSVRQRIVQRLAAIGADTILGRTLDALGEALLLTERLPTCSAPSSLTFSGGVAEYMFGHESKEFGDIAKMLAEALAGELSHRTALPLIDPGQRIRATVIGASQFTVQVSGKTIYLPDPYVLPVHNVPVVHVGLDLTAEIETGMVAAAIRGKVAQMDLDPAARMAIAFAWHGDPEYSRLKAMARAVVEALEPGAKRDELLLLMIDGDVGKTFGRLLHRELNWPGKIVSIDGVQLQELDYVDVGELIAPPGVVPVVIKSLLFA
jgi:ethanolamine utilization protein EutA